MTTHSNGHTSLRVTARSSANAPPPSGESYAVLALEAAGISVGSAVLVYLTTWLPLPLGLLCWAGLTMALIWHARALRARWRLLRPSNYKAYVAAQQHQALQYARQWYCQSCGHVFVPPDPLDSSSTL
ncbi:hypothetical protein KAK06_05875 [Ideonella sp. 4Y11]|uniref:Uncharacterized protein n=1 Tax=Ideonella aquatica TaxID=2824119 RepID=A0A941BIE1_9BURK|nr:hypothetical protein [Ideonella aquatica]MBQ0958482.1 hypothetical protein [Ideonella aquatica]